MATTIYFNNITMDLSNNYSIILKTNCFGSSLKDILKPYNVPISIRVERHVRLGVVINESTFLLWS